jgi:transposase
MPKEQSRGKPTTRRYSEEEAAAVRTVRTLRAELGSEHGTVKRWANSSATGSSRCGCGFGRPASMTVTNQGRGNAEAARIRELGKRSGSRVGSTTSSVRFRVPVP